MKRRYRQFYQRDLNAAVLAVCRYAMDLLRFAGCAPLRPLQTPEAYARAVVKNLPWIDRERLEWLFELAQRARFSGKACAKQERDQAVAITGAIWKELSVRLPRVRRWFFRWRFPALQRGVSG